MDSKQVEARATELFRSGLHCAEAVLQAVMEGQGRTGVSPRAATAFGGGIGRSKTGPCGALSGGLIALGLVLGRDRPDRAKWDAAAALAAALQGWFAAEFGGPRCGAVLERLGPQERDAECIRLAGRTAGRVHALLESATTGHP